TAAFANGEVHWVRAVLDVNNEASGNDVFFYTSEDGETWTQLGNTVTTAGVTSIFDSTSAVEIGSRFGGTVGALAGSVYYVEIRNGIDGTVVNSFDASTVTPAGPRDPATVTAGGPWTINGASWSWASGT
ncbi:MAG TPA: hypothetical protein VEG38_08860, partial [Acidimicrobiia bacterium]|nr:hypothetical protein [Acidimicrobiia bacterium]